MDKEKKLELLQEVLLNLKPEQKKDYLSEWQDANNYIDDAWIDICEFNGLSDGMTPIEIINSIDMECFNTNDGYFKYSRYGIITGNMEDIEKDFDDDIIAISKWYLERHEEKCNDLIFYYFGIDLDDLEEE